MTRLNSEEKIDRIYVAIAGDPELGVRGIEERLVKVENFMERLSWLVWFGGLIPKAVLFILTILNIYLIGNQILRR